MIGSNHIHNSTIQSEVKKKTNQKPQQNSTIQSELIKIDQSETTTEQNDPIRSHENRSIRNHKIDTVIHPGVSPSWQKRQAVQQRVRE